MATEGTELERLIVRLVGDGSDYQKMLQESLKSTQETAAAVMEHGKKIEGFGKNLEGFASKATSALGAIGIAVGMEKALGKFEEFEKRTIRLNAVLESNGRNVSQATKEYKKLADEMLEVNAVSRGTTMGLAKQAESFGLTGEAAKKAIKDSLAFAAINDSDAESMIRITAAMAQGDTERAMMFSRMIPQLRGVKDETEFVARYTRLAEAGTKAMAEEAQTVGGRWKQVEAVTGKVTKEIGGVIAQVAGPLVAVLSGFVAIVDKMDPTLRKMIIGILAALAALEALTVASGLASTAVTFLTARFVGYTGVMAAATLATTAFKIAIGVALVYAAQKIADVISGVDKMKKQLADLEAGGEKAREAGRTYWDDRIEKAKGSYEELDALLRETADPFGKGTLFGAKRGRVEAKKALKEFGEGIKGGIREGLAGTSDFMRSTIGIDIVPFGSALSTQKKELENAAKLSDGFVKDAEDQAEKIKAAMRSLAKETATGAASAITAGIAESLKVLTDTQELTKSLQIEADTYGQSSREISLYKMQLAGATDAQLEEARAISNKLDLMDQHKKVMSEAEQIIKDFATPQQKYNDRVKQLNDILAAGGFKGNIDAYNAAIADAKKTLEGTGDAAHKAMTEVKGLDAALSGSAEAKARFAAQRDLINRPGATARSTQNAPPANAAPIAIQPAAPIQQFNAESAKTLVEIRDILKGMSKGGVTILSGIGLGGGI